MPFTAAWITLEGQVDQGMADYTKRAIAQATEQKPDYIIFEINTFGGLLSAAFEIVDTITAIQGATTVSLVKQKAISAGALIALASQKLYMMPTTTIGDCAPIVQGGEEGVTIVGEKIQSPLRARFRNLAQRNGYPELLSEAMVSPSLEVIEMSLRDSSFVVSGKEYEDLPESIRTTWKRKTLVDQGELLTMTELEAQHLGFTTGLVDNAEALKQALQVKITQNVNISWAETLARFLAGIAPILMMVGFGALYMEFQAPGFGIFGITGIVALLIAFAGPYVSGLAGQLPLALLILGIVLVVLEIVVIPGTWMAGTAGVGLMIAALILAFREVPLPDWALPNLLNLDMSGLELALLQVLGSSVLGLIFPILLARIIIPRMPQNHTPLLQNNLQTAQIPDHPNSHIQPGQQGITLSMLRPSGKIQMGHQVLEAQARDGFIEAHQPIQIDRIDGHTLWVIPLATQPSEKESL